MTRTDNTRLLHEATLSLLARTGVFVGSDEALNLFADHGVRVNRDVKRVYPEERHVQQALATVPNELVIYGRGPHNRVRLGGADGHVLAGGGSLRVLALDGSYESSTWEHLRQFNVLLDALPNIHLCINQVDPQDDTGGRYYVRIAVEMLIGMPKPCLLQAFNGDDVQAYYEMGVAVRGSPEALAAEPLFVVAANAEPPLSISEHVAELLLAAFKAGLPSHLGNYNMMGITAPITVAGAVVQINAVQLVALILSQIVRPGISFIYTAFSGAGNMRTLDPVTSNPYAFQQQLLAAELGHWYNLPVYVHSGNDAKEPDSQAACEIGVQLMGALEAGFHLIQGPTSMMDSMMMSSFAQAVIDNDISGYVFALRSQPEISEDTLALDVMHEVVTDPELRSMKFAAHAHTAKHLRDATWEPKCFTRDSFANWQKKGSQTILERATTVARDILAHHQPQSLNPEVIREIQNIAKKG